MHDYGSAPAGCKMTSNGDVQTSLLPDASPPSASVTASLAWDMHKGFPSVLGVILAALIACFSVFTKYSDDIDADEFYLYFVHVSVMVFVGFGFLMTFLKRYSLSAVSLNLVASCMMMLCAMLLVRSRSAHGAHGSLLALNPVDVLMHKTSSLLWHVLQLCRGDTAADAQQGAASRSGRACYVKGRAMAAERSLRVQL
jgi:hypothetical protein